MREATEKTPEALLANTIEAIGGATFIGKGEGAMVAQMLSELEWTIKTAVESAAMLLRIDEIVSGTHKKEKKAPGVSDREKAAQAEGVDGAAE